MSDWISVDNSLPEKGCRVLVYAIKSDSYRSFTFGIRQFGNSWYENHSGEDIEVTHWMPLPEPPK